MSLKFQDRLRTSNGKSRGGTEDKYITDYTMVDGRKDYD